MSDLSSLSIEDLKKELEQREGALSGLYEKREKLEAELKEVNDQIAAGGSDDGGGDDAKGSAARFGPRGRRGRPAEKAPRPPARLQEQAEGRGRQVPQRRPQAAQER